MKLSTHPGEVALPGGKMDEEDLDDSATALREAKEEIGLKSNLVQVITNLEPFISLAHIGSVNLWINAFLHPSFRTKGNYRGSYYSLVSLVEERVDPVWPRCLMWLEEKIAFVISASLRESPSRASSSL
ncbi:hypothetical protein KY285_037595 [Solanum tuberosum]|nr:hypothetical protein KY285_037595 [Solanum tuberosum]